MDECPGCARCADFTTNDAKLVAEFQILRKVFRHTVREEFFIEALQAEIRRKTETAVLTASAT